MNPIDVYNQIIFIAPKFTEFANLYDEDKELWYVVMMKLRKYIYSNIEKDQQNPQIDIGKELNLLSIFLENLVFHWDDYSYDLVAIGLLENVYPSYQYYNKFMDFLWPKCKNILWSHNMDDRLIKKTS